MSTVTPIHVGTTPLRPVAERATGALTVGRMVLLAAERGGRCAALPPRWVDRDAHVRAVGGPMPGDRAWADR